MHNSLLLAVFMLIGTLTFAQSPGGISTTSMNLWIKADLGTSCTANGCSVSTWSDQSGNSNNATQTGTSRPTFQEVATNYNPGVDIIGNVAPKQHFVLPNSTVPPGGSDYTVLYVANNVNSTGFIIAGGVNINHQANRFRCDANGGTNNSWQNVVDDLATPANTMLAGRRSLISTNYSLASSGRNTFLRAFIGGTNPSTAINTNTSNNKIGLREDGGGNLVGDINEVVVFSRSLSAVEQNKAESYLGVKYGVTLDNAGGGAQGDYFATNNTLIWDANVSPSYHNDVIGIGRDDADPLYQKQSHTFDDTTRIYIDNLSTSNALNGGTINNDISYVLIGDNTDKMCATTASAAEMPTALFNCSLYSRLEREWKITKTNFPQDFHGDFKLNACAVIGSVNIAELRVLIDDDGDFSNGGTSCYYNGDGTGIVISYSNPVITISNIGNLHIPDNSVRYMTIASILQSTPLPVTLVNFDVTCTEKDVHLTWQTTSEINNAYFTIERSRDGTSFDELTTVNGNGTSSSPIFYNWTDESPIAGTAYYRVKQTNYDGTSELHPTIKSVSCGEKDEFKFYPNPFGDQLTIVIQTGGHVEILDVTGKIVFSQILSAGEITLDLSHIAGGSYFLKTILNNGENPSFKLVKK